MAGKLDGAAADSNAFEINVPLLIKEVENRKVLWDFRPSVGGDVAAQKAAWKEVYRVVYPNFDQQPEDKQQSIGNYIEQRWGQLKETFLKSMGELKEDKQYVTMLYFLTTISPSKPQPERADDHSQFFDSIMYEVRKFDDDQTLLFRGEVIKIIQMIKCAAAYSKSQPANPYPDPYGQEYAPQDYSAIAAPPPPPPPLPPAQAPIPQYNYQQQQPVPSIYTSRYFQDCTQLNAPTSSMPTGYSSNTARSDAPPFIIYTNDCGSLEKRYMQCQEDCISLDSDCNPFIRTSSDEC